MADKDNNSPADSYNPTEKEKGRLNESYDRFVLARDNRDPVTKNFESFEKQWEGYFSDELEDTDRDATGEYRSNVWVPMTFWITMTAMSEYIQQNPSLVLLPTGDEDAPMAEVMQEITNYSMEIGSFIIQLYKAFLDASIFGTAPLYEYYRCENRVIKELSNYDPEKEKAEWKKKKITSFKDVYAESFSPYHFYPQPGAEDMDTCGWAFRRFIFDHDEFMALYKDKFKNVSKVKAAIDHLNQDPDWQWWNTTGMTYLKENQVEVLWEWNKTKDDMNVLANGVLLTDPDMPIPFNHKEIPITIINSTKRSHRLWGKGMAEILEKLQYERNVIRNISLDQMRLNILKVFFINPEAGLTEDQLKLKPGLAIPVKGDPRQAVYPLEYSGIKSERYKEEEMMDSDAVRASGVSPELTGIPKADSATQAAIMRDSAIKRIRLQMLIAYEDGLTRLGRLRLANIKQFYQNPSRVEKIIGEDGTETLMKEYRKVRLKDKALAINEETGQYYLQTGEDVKGFNFFQTIPDLFKSVDDRYYSYDVKVDPQSAVKVSETMRQEQEKAFFETFRNDPDIDQKKLKTDYIESMDKNPEELITKGPILPPEVGGGAEGVSPFGQSPTAQVPTPTPGGKAASRVIPGMDGENL